MEQMEPQDRLETFLDLISFKRLVNHLYLEPHSLHLVNLDLVCGEVFHLGFNNLVLQLVRI
jgi:hypothetical protein